MTKIEHPYYYSAGGMEAIDFIDAHGLNFNLGNVVKYITRAGRKDGEDTPIALQKAQWYLEREIEQEKERQGYDKPVFHEHGREYRGCTNSGHCQRRKTGGSKVCSMDCPYWDAEYINY